MSKTYDAIIIGAGVIGACTAFELAKKGYKTLSIDKLPEAGHGSTSGSCAIIRTYYSAFETCAIAYEGWHYWKDWASYIGLDDTSDLITYHDTGCLVMKTPVNHHLTRACDVMDEIGCPYEHVEAKDIAHYLQGVDLSNYHPAKTLRDEAFGKPTGGEVSGAVFFPCGGYVNDPKLSAQNVQKAAQAQGAEFKFNASVAKILQSGDRVNGVELNNGEVISAPIVVNVAGPHSSIINEMAGVSAGMKMSTRALRHEVAHVPAPDGYSTSGSCITSDSDVHVYSRPEQGNYILIGSEDPECDDREWIDDPDNYNENLTEQCRTLAMRLGQRLPNLPIPEATKGVVALYDVSEDWMPIYDCSDLKGFYMACGTSGNQYKNAPVAGKIMTAIIEACEAGHDHDAYPIKFKLAHIDTEISLDFCSRNREINQNSSFSVIG